MGRISDLDIFESHASEQASDIPAVRVRHAEGRSQGLGDAGGVGSTPLVGLVHVTAIDQIAGLVAAGDGQVAVFAGEIIGRFVDVALDQAFAAQVDLALVARLYGPGLGPAGPAVGNGEVEGAAGGFDAVKARGELTF